MNNDARDQRRANSAVESDTRTALLEATRECVREHGTAGATSRLIAAQADANLGAITYYFGSKEELVAEALFGELSTRLEPLMAELEGDDPAPTRLLNAVQRLVSEFEASADDVPIYLNALMLSTEAGPFADRGRDVITNLQRRLSDVISQLKDENAIAGWVDPDAMAALLIASANGIALQSRLDPDGPGVVELASQLVNLLLAASNPGSSGQ